MTHPYHFNQTHFDTKDAPPVRRVTMDDIAMRINNWLRAGEERRNGKALY